MLEELSLATTPAELWEAVQRYQTGYDPGIYLSGVDSLDALMQNPQAARAAIQAGVSPAGISGANDILTERLRATATVIAAARAGDPSAQAFLQNRARQRQNYIALARELMSPPDLGPAGAHPTQGGDAVYAGHQFDPQGPTTVGEIMRGLMSGEAGTLQDLATRGLYGRQDPAPFGGWGDAIPTQSYDVPNVSHFLDIDPSLVSRYGLGRVLTTRLDPRNAAAGRGRHPSPGCRAGGREPKRRLRLGIGADERRERGWTAFHAAFTKRYPHTGESQFRRYHRLARQIVEALERRPLAEQRQAQRFIMARIVAPLGDTLEPHEIPEAWDRMRSTALALARRLGMDVDEPQAALSTLSTGGSGQGLRADDRQAVKSASAPLEVELGPAESERPRDGEARPA